MFIPLRKEIIRLRARIIKNILATISITVMFSACGGSGSENENTTNEDSLKQVREQERLDSIAHADSIVVADSLAQAKVDSMARSDSLKHNQTYTLVNPVVTPPDYPATDYGVLFPYDEPDYPIDKYGVPVPEDIN